MHRQQHETPLMPNTSLLINHSERQRVHNILRKGVFFWNITIQNVSKSVYSHQQKVPTSNINISYNMNECNVTTSPFHTVTQQYRHSESVPMIYFCPPLHICIKQSVE